MIGKTSYTIVLTARYNFITARPKDLLISAAIASMISLSCFGFKDKVSDKFN